MLTSLNLSSCNELTGAGVKELAACVHLTSLNLLGCSRVGDDGIIALAACKDLAILNLLATQLTDRGIKEISKMKNLIELTLYNTLITDDGVKYLAACQDLQYLNLSFCKWITATGIREITSCKRLAVFCFERINLNSDQIAELKTALPNCKMVN
jgi:hypothetical protein